MHEDAYSRQFSRPGRRRDGVRLGPSDRTRRRPIRDRVGRQGLALRLHRPAQSDDPHRRGMGPGVGDASLRPGAVAAATAVDFRVAVVVLAAAGTRPNGCYSIEITGVRPSIEGQPVFDVLETRPGANCACTEVITRAARGPHLTIHGRGGVSRAGGRSALLTEADRDGSVAAAPGRPTPPLEAPVLRGDGGSFQLPRG